MPERLRYQTTPYSTTHTQFRPRDSAFTTIFLFYNKYTVPRQRDCLPKQLPILQQIHSPTPERLRSRTTPDTTTNTQFHARETALPNNTRYYNKHTVPRQRD